MRIDEIEWHQGSDKTRLFGVRESISRETSQRTSLRFFGKFERRPVVNIAFRCVGTTSLSSWRKREGSVHVSRIDEISREFAAHSQPL